MRRSLKLLLWLWCTVQGMFLLNTQEFLDILKQATPSGGREADKIAASNLNGAGTSPESEAKVTAEESSWFGGGGAPAKRESVEEDDTTGKARPGFSAWSWSFLFGRGSNDTTLAEKQQSQSKEEANTGGGQEGAKEATGTFFLSFLSSSPPPLPSNLPCYVPSQQVSVVRLVNQVWSWALNDTSVVVEMPPFTVDVPLLEGLLWWDAVFCFGVMMGMILPCILRTPRRMSYGARKLRTSLVLRQEQRLKQEEEEQANAIEAVKRILNNPGVSKKEEWGSRLQKYWFMEPSSPMDLVVTIAPLPKGCYLNVEHYQSRFNDFLGKLRHQFIQPVMYIKHYRKNPSDQSDSDKVIIGQLFWPQGSLRDLIHNEETPNRDWSGKYLSDGIPLSPEHVIKFGRQILEGLLYLYDNTFEAISLKPLGHLHVGNIYLDNEGNCRLGGCENKLLGYKTFLYRKILKNGCLPDIDIVMFGHVIYEMCTGRVLSELFPSEEEYSLVKEAECREILGYIFARKENGRLAHSISQIRKKPFFATPKPPTLLVSGQVKNFMIDTAKDAINSLLQRVQIFPVRRPAPVISLPLLSVSKPLSPRGPKSTKHSATASKLQPSSPVPAATTESGPLQSTQPTPLSYMESTSITPSLPAQPPLSKGDKFLHIFSKVAIVFSLLLLFVAVLFIIYGMLQREQALRDRNWKIDSQQDIN